MISTEASFNLSLLSKRKQIGKQSKSLKIDGKVISDLDELRERWRMHYSDPYTPKHNPKFDNEFAAHIEHCIKTYEVKSHNASHDILDDPFNADEVAAICRNLPNNKSSGPDGLTYEHVKFGGPALLETLTRVLNVIRTTETIPKCFKIENIVSLFKTNKKDRYDKDNYRGITLLNIIGKIILDKWMPLFVDMGFPNRLQYAYQKGKSSTDASMSLQEAVHHNIERGSKVYSCFLDSKKN